MRQTRQYHLMEKRILSGLGRFFAALGNSLSRLLSFFDRKLTVMVVPHSHDRVVHLQTNMFAMILGGILIGGIIATCLYFSQNSLAVNEEISHLRNENRETLASFDEMRDENNNLLQVSKRFKSAMSRSLSLLGITPTNSMSQTPARSSDLAALLTTEDISSGSARETNNIRDLTAYLENSIVPIERMSHTLELYGTLFTDIPSIWPIKNGIGHISMQFGQGINPITGQYYIHKGLDLSTYRTGDPVIVTANGQVVGINYDPYGYGNYIIVKHKHGIYTLYAHMSTVRIRKGDFVSQGDVIGSIGGTGVVTGPHLHYEVHIGSDVVDPVKYVNLKIDK
ncbi:MAG: M23 family metallopeptidase [Spirochaetaceae bacterium]|nr:M23 family metallopeptidase [Spirochaetaceae bacterium]